jgi:hypothetical protein
MLGDVFESDGNLQLLEGTGSAYPFGFNIDPRIFNGTMFYSLGTASVEEVEDIALFNVHPLPGNEGFQVNFPSRVSGTLTVSDMTGRVIDERLVNPNSNMVQVDMKGEGAGLYVVTMNTGSTSRSQKVVLSK